MQLSQLAGCKGQTRASLNPGQNALSISCNVLFKKNQTTKQNQQNKRNQQTYQQQQKKTSKCIIFIQSEPQPMTLTQEVLLLWKWAFLLKRCIFHWMVSFFASLRLFLICG